MLRNLNGDSECCTQDRPLLLDEVVKNAPSPNALNQISQEPPASEPLTQSRKVLSTSDPSECPRLTCNLCSCARSMPARRAAMISSARPSCFSAGVTNPIVQSVLVVVHDEGVGVGDELDRIRVSAVVETLALERGEEALDRGVGVSRQQHLMQTERNEPSV
jgi:hypothetical protein